MTQARPFAETIRVVAHKSVFVIGGVIVVFLE
jgi:hypothetical protein